MRARELGASLIVIVVGGFPAVAQAPEAESLGSRLQELVASFHGNGDFSGVVAVSRNRELIGHATAGYSDYASEREHDLHTTFHIASITKTFTAAAIQRLEAGGKLVLDERLATFLPSFPRGEDITIRHLLTHRSGVPDYWSLTGVGELSSRPTTLDRLVGWLADAPLDFEPGARSSYSNSGYALLAAVVEAATGEAFHAYLSGQVLVPAGLEETTTFRGHADAIGYRPAYTDSGLEPAAPYDPSLLVGSGSLQSSASDLLTWCAAFNSLHTGGSLASAYGWGSRSQHGRSHAEQTGRNPGFSAHLRAYPRSGTCVVVLSNLESDAVSEIGGTAAAMAFGETARLPNRRVTIEVPEEDLAGYPGSYEIAPGTRVEISQTAAGLLLRGPNGDFLPLETIGKDLFFYRQLYTSITGERSPTGEVTALLWGGEYRVPRLR